MIDRRLSVAPMMDWTDRHDRYFLRLLSKNALLYTEMVTTGALIHGANSARFLRFDATEHPVACQLGGSDPAALALCARMVEDAAFDEVNLNVGCPSDRVQNGTFGACMMAEPALVADCVHAMIESVSIPVTVKTRIGIDHQDSYEALHHFIQTVASAGCKVFIIHARKAWLNGLSPKQNREVPPLRYDVVYALKRDFAECEFILNGGINTVAAALAESGSLDGVMIGRAAYQNPYILADLDAALFGETDIPTRDQVIERFIPYVERQLKEGVYMSNITRHILGLYQAQPGARRFRRYISENARLTQCAKTLLYSAIRAMEGSDVAA